MQNTVRNFFCCSKLVSQHSLTVAHGILDMFYLFNKGSQLQAKRPFAECFDANFKQQDSCARCSGEVLACYQKSPISRKSTVAESVFTPISSNSKLAHNFEQQHGCALCLLQVLSKRANRISWILLTKHTLMFVDLELRALFPKGFRSNGKFQATGRLLRVFWTIPSFVTKVADFKQNDSCAVFLRQFRLTEKLRTNSGKSTVALFTFYKFYLKEQIEFLPYY